MYFNPVVIKSNQLPQRKIFWHPEIKKYCTIFRMQRQSEGHSATKGSYQCPVIPLSDLHNMVFSKVTFNTWKLKIQMSNTSQKNLFEAFTLGTIKLWRKRTCVNKNVTKSKVENHHYKTAALINTWLENLFHVLSQAATSWESCFSTLPWKSNLQILAK